MTFVNRPTRRAFQVRPGLGQRGIEWVLFALSAAVEMPGFFEDLTGASKAFLSSYAATARRELEAWDLSIVKHLPSATAPQQIPASVATPMLRLIGDLSVSLRPTLTRESPPLRWASPKPGEMGNRAFLQ